VCTIVVQKCVDSNTGLPLTFGVVERALREAHFAVHLAKAAKQQALAAIKLLEQSSTICRAKMRLRVEISASADCARVTLPPPFLCPSNSLFNTREILMCTAASRTV
jgi:ribosome maturation protein Sdo1